MPAPVEKRLKALIVDHGSGLFLLLRKYGYQVDDLTPSMLISIYAREGVGFAKDVQKLVDQNSQNFGGSDVLGLLNMGLNVAKSLGADIPGEQPTVPADTNIARADVVPATIWGVPKSVFIAGAIMAALVVVFLFVNKKSR